MKASVPLFDDDHGKSIIEIVRGDCCTYLCKNDAKSESWTRELAYWWRFRIRTRELAYWRRFRIGSVYYTASRLQTLSIDYPAIGRFPLQVSFSVITSFDADDDDSDDNDEDNNEQNNSDYDKHISVIWKY